MNNGCSEDMLQQYMENTTILKSITYNNNIYPNGGGVDCTCTFFRWLFLHEKRVLRSQIF